MFGLKTNYKNILEVQKCDTEIDGLTADIQNISEKALYEDLQLKIKALQEKETQLRKVYDEKKAALNKVNGELDLLGQKISKEEQKLFSGKVTNPKELSALQEEVASLNRKRDDIETEVLEQMEDVSLTEEELSKVKQQTTENTNKTSEAEVIWKKKEAELNEAKRKLIERREAKAKEVDSELLADYEEIRENKDGIGAGELVDDVCQACHVKLSEIDLEKVIDSEEYEYCPFCGRILIKK